MQTEDQILESLIHELGNAGLAKDRIIWLLGESFKSLCEQDFWIGQRNITNHLDGLIYYWATEYSWCIGTPIWESEYTELEYYYIQEFLNAFPNHPLVQEFSQPMQPLPIN